MDMKKLDCLIQFSTEQAKLIDRLKLMVVIQNRLAVKSGGSPLRGDWWGEVSGPMREAFELLNSTGGE